MLSCRTPSFIIFVNNLRYTAIYNKVRHFADLTNLFFANKSFKKKNKYIDHDLAFIDKLFRANEVGLNMTKTEIIIFCAKK